MEDERVWQVAEIERERALLEKLAEGRQALAWMVAPDDLAPLARRSRCLLFSRSADVVRGLPDRAFSLVVLDGPAVRGYPLVRRLLSSAALVVLVDPEHTPTGLAVFQRVGRLRVCRAVAA